MSLVIFLGTLNSSSVVLRGLIGQGCGVKTVVTQPDKRVGRKQIVHQSAVKQTALRRNLPVYQLTKLSRSDKPAELMRIEPDLIVTAVYGQFLPTKSLKSVEITPANVHSSFLSEYRDGTPVQYLILNGDGEIGIIITKMVKKTDVGGIFLRKALPIEADDTGGTLFDELGTLGGNLLLEALLEFVDGTITRTSQNEAKAVSSPNISKGQEQIELLMTAEQANNLTRALSPDSDAYLMFDGKRFKIQRTKPLAEKTSFPTGILVTNKKKFVISMASGDELELLEVQPTGKKKMNTRGYLDGQDSHFTSEERTVDE